MNLQSPEQTAAWLLARNHFTILTHRRPDGDTVGCAAALCAGLRSLGKDASVLRNPQITERYGAYLEGLTATEAEGCIVSTDVSSRAQMPLNYSGRVDLCIDHHGSNDGYAEATCLEAESGACAELVYKILKAMKVSITPAMADALYVGVSTDTGCFRYANTSPQSLRTAAELKEAGADTVSINRAIFEIKSKARFAVEAYLAENLKLYAGGKVGICILPDAVNRRIGASEDDIDSLAGFARTLEGVEIGALLRDLPTGQSKVSLRTDSRLWDASAICSLMGGGGHAAAAGAAMNCPLAEIHDRLLKAIGEATGFSMTEVV